MIILLFEGKYNCIDVYIDKYFMCAKDPIYECLEKKTNNKIAKKMRNSNGKVVYKWDMYRRGSTSEKRSKRNKQTNTSQMNTRSFRNNAFHKRWCNML
jgi:hypothetical protein